MIMKSFNKFFLNFISKRIQLQQNNKPKLILKKLLSLLSLLTIVKKRSLISYNNNKKINYPQKRKKREKYIRSLI